MTVAITLTAADGATETLTLPEPTVVAAGFPSAATTGYGSTTLTPATSNTISAAGTYSGLHFTGTVSIKASNVTLENCLFDTLPASAPWQVGIPAGLSNVVIDHCTFIGNGTAATGPGVYGVYIQGNSQVTISNCDMSQLGQMIALNDGQVQVLSNYIHDLNSGAGTHYEALYYGGAAKSSTFSLLIQGNYWISTQSNAVCYIENYFGPVNNVTINANLFVGSPTHGSYTVYVEGNQNPNNITNVAVTNNAIGKSQFGYMTLNKGLAPVYQVTDTGNYDYLTKAPVS